MIYKIIEISTDKASGHTYVLVHFWAKKADQIAGKSPHCINDFLMQLRPHDDDDLSAQIKANIEAYWERAEAAEAAGKPYPRDHSNSRIQRDNSDPHGVLARADVAALRGKEVDKP